MSAWIGPHPENCESCKRPITNRFYDAKTVYGPWAFLCPACFARIGVGLGIGRGQHYKRTSPEHAFHPTKPEPH